MNQVAEEQELDPAVQQLAKNIDRFLQNSKKRGQELDSSGERRNLSLEALIQSSEPLSEEAVGVFFEREHEYLVAPEVVAEVRRVFGEMRDRLNGFPAKKRFFILETMDFFNSKISIGKLIPALMVLEGMDQKRAIAEFIRPTFLSINKNVEILTSTNEIFNPKTIHLDRGSLYTLVSDIARILTGLFLESYLDSFSEISSHVELILRVMDENPVFKGKGNAKDAQMQEDPAVIRAVVLEFVSTIQSHEALYNYSVKRHAYYRLFLARLTSGRRFGGVEPFEVSRVFAGCLLANEQLAPPTELIERMVDPENFNSPEVLKARREFVEQLSPMVVYKLIGDIKTTLQNLTQSDFNREFGDVTRLSVKNILKRVWSAFILLGEKGFELMTEPFKVIFQMVKSTYRTFVAEEGTQGLDGSRKTSAKPAAEAVVEAGKEVLIPKNAQAVSCLSRFRLVKTDVVAFRGEFDGASQKDYGYNARLFKQDELVLMRFLHTFERLFQAMEHEAALYVIRFQAQHKIREYYAAFEFDEQLICLGLTHQKSVSINQIQQKDIFPYILLFSSAQDKAFGRVLSRKVEESGRLYNEESLTANNTKIFYEATYILLHSLPERDWNSLDCQMAIKFLVQELEKVKDSKGFLFLTGAPKLPANLSF